jgi:hypothetical protein
MADLADEWAAKLARKAEAMARAEGAPVTVMAMTQTRDMTYVSHTTLGAATSGKGKAQMPTASGVKAKADEILAVVNWFLGERKRLLESEDYSESYKKRKLAEVREKAYAAASREAKAIFGAGGQFWQSLARAQNRLSAARDAAEKAIVPDPNRVILAQQRLPSIFGQPGWDLFKARRWVTSEASTAEKVALALSGESVVVQGLTGIDTSSAREIVRLARGWYEAALETIEVQSARDELAKLDAAGQQAMRAVQSAAVAFGDRVSDGFWRPSGEGDFAAIIASVSREAAGEWSLQE